MDIFNLLAGACSIISIVLWYVERKKRYEVEREEKRRIWSEICKVKALMGGLERGCDNIDDNSIQKGVLQVHGKLAFMLRDLFREAVNKERILSLETVRLWRKVGKISSDWQERIVLNLMLSEDIRMSETIDKEILNKYSDWDTIDREHPLNPNYPYEHSDAKDITPSEFRNSGDTNSTNSANSGDT